MLLHSSIHMHTHSHIASYQQLPNRIYAEKIATHRYLLVHMTPSHTYSPLKMSCSTLWILKGSFFVALNGLQKSTLIDKTEGDFAHTQLHTVATNNDLITETCGSLLRMSIHLQLLCGKLKKCSNAAVLHSGDSVKAVAHQL